MNENSAWKTKVIVLGGVFGLLLGLAAAFFFVKNQPDDASPAKLTSKDGVKLGLGAVSFIKQIAELGK